MLQPLDPSTHILTIHTERTFADDVDTLRRRLDADREAQGRSL